MPRKKSTVVLNEMVIKDLPKAHEDEPLEETKGLIIPKRCDWIRKEKGVTCFKLNLCIYCRAPENVEKV